MRSDVRLQPLGRALLTELLHAAIEDADPREVMPPVAGPSGWTPERQAAFVRFHESRSLAAEPVETTFAIVVGERVVGAARLCPLEEAVGAVGAVEAGVWIGRSHRGVGVGGAVFGRLLDRARADGFDALFVRTTPDNTAVKSLLASVGVGLVREGDALTARVDLAADVR